MASTTVIWKNSITPEVVASINIKLAEILNGAESDSSFLRTFDAENPENDRLTVTRYWADAETAQIWLDFCKTFTDYFVSGTVE